MHLRDYLKEHGLTASAFAAKIGCSISTVTRAMRGEVVPEKATMEKIVAATGGKVQPNDFYEELKNGGPGPGQPNGAESETAAASDSDKVPAGGKVSASADGGSEAA